MNILDAIILGVVQGLTEFLPISSSGHLVIAQHLLKDFKQPGVLFDVTLHLGTLLAVVMYFKKDIISILYSIFSARSEDKYGSKMVLLIIAATIPTGIIGIVFKDFFESLFTSIIPVAFSLMITGLLLFTAERVKNISRKEEAMGFKDALIIGIVQGISIIPGISRSGSTISAGLFQGIDRMLAARFSFLLSIPAILGAVVLEGRHAASVANDEIFSYIAGAFAAMVVGYVSIGILMKMIQNRRLSYFAFYCWALGIGVLIYSLLK